MKSWRSPWSPNRRAVQSTRAEKGGQEKFSAQGGQKQFSPQEQRNAVNKSSAHKAVKSSSVHKSWERRSRISNHTRQQVQMRSCASSRHIQLLARRTFFSYFNGILKGLSTTDQCHRLSQWNADAATFFDFGRAYGRPWRTGSPLSMTKLRTHSSKRMVVNVNHQPYQHTGEKTQQVTV